MQELPFILKEALLLSVSRSQWTIVLLSVPIWLEWSFLLKSNFTLIQPLLLPVQVLRLLHRQSLLNSKRRVTLRSHDTVSLVFEQLVRLPKSLRLVSKLLSIVLLLVGTKNMAIFLVIG